MTSLNQFIATEFYSMALGINPDTVRKWRARGVPKRYHPWVRDESINLALRILQDMNYEFVKHDAAECGPVASRPSRARWIKVRDIVTAQLVEEGYDPKELLETGIRAKGEERFWKDYMKGQNCAERMAKHEAKEKTA